jgi:hypothetical protein
MGQIYSDANEVLAWLGNQHDTMEVAFDFLSEKAFEDGETWQLRTCSYHSPDQRWNALREFCDLTYWTRRWIIQEIVVAKNVVLQYRDIKIPLSTAEEVFKKFADLPSVFLKAIETSTGPLSSTGPQSRIAGQLSCANTGSPVSETSSHLILSRS